MPAAATQTITLATRDSLLAMAQTVSAARRLAAAGFNVRIRSLKTSGDLKLDAALYTVASRVPAKEGRAFFTKELDEALLSGAADAAVHSFKDLPYESVPGIAEPILFSEQTGSDLLILRKGTHYGARGEGLLIGTSSLRRIHQLQLTLPAARTLVLRGNVVTRLHKLETLDRGINALLIAGAGLRRLEEFTAQADDYDHFLEGETLAHLRGEIRRFRALCHNELDIIELSEVGFPTAPGQGVLAFQFSTAAALKLESSVKDIFPEHNRISPRVKIERQIMRSLETGCHAPLGVSALPNAFSGYAVHACFSRKSTTDPVSFADSIYISRHTAGDSQKITAEIRRGTTNAFWWGSMPEAAPKQLQLTTVKAFRQVDLEPTRTQSALPAAIFVASPAALPWLARESSLHSLPIWAAGQDTLRHVREKLPAMQAMVAQGKGFAAALVDMREKISGNILWLGSKSGQPRAQKIAGNLPVEFLAVYDNEVLTPAEIDAAQPLLRAGAADSLHLVASAAAARALVTYMRGAGILSPLVSCFGESATDVLVAEKILPYHVSRAPSFAQYLNEIGGSTECMTLRLKAQTGSENETEKK